MSIDDCSWFFRLDKTPRFSNGAMLTGSLFPGAHTWMVVKNKPNRCYLNHVQSQLLLAEHPRSLWLTSPMFLSLNPAIWVSYHSANKQGWFPKSYVYNILCLIYIYIYITYSIHILHVCIYIYRDNTMYGLPQNRVANTISWLTIIFPITTEILVNICGRKNKVHWDPLAQLAIQHRIGHRAP